MADPIDAIRTAQVGPGNTRRARMRVHAIVNMQGKAAVEGGPEGIHDRLAAAFTGAGIDATVELVAGVALLQAVRSAVEVHASADSPVLDAIVIGGGDGTIGTAAGILAGTGIPMGVLPLGTLNHFARDLGVPAVPEMAALVIAEGHTRDVDLAEVNGRIFVNNSSIGIYPYMVELRDHHRQALGLGKWAAMALAFLAMMRRFPVHRLAIRMGTGAVPRKTPCAIVSNNLYNLDVTAFGGREALDRGELGVYIARSRSRLRFFILIVRAALGRLQPARDFDLIRAKEIEIHAHSRRLRVAADGEIEKIAPPLRYRIRPGALRVLVSRGAAR